jgi:hypothetical protein
MYFKITSRYNVLTSAYEPYCRLVESYRNCEGSVCHKTIIQVGFMPDAIPEQMNMIQKQLTLRAEGKVFLFEESNPIEAELSKTQMKMDKLVNSFLDGIIERSIYLVKKDELIKRKIELEFTLKDSGQKSKLWVEPMKEWLNLAHSAGKLAFSTDYVQVKNLLEKIGTNRILKEKELGVNFVPPFDILLRYRRLAIVNGQEKEEKKKGLTRKNPISPVLWRTTESNR